MTNSEDVKQLRGILGITQKELAEIIGTSIKTVANYEAGAVIPIAKQRLLQGLLMEARKNMAYNTNNTDIVSEPQPEYRSDDKDFIIQKQKDEITLLNRYIGRLELLLEQHGIGYESVKKGHNESKRVG